MWEKLITFLVDKGIIAAEKKSEVTETLKDFKNEPINPPGQIMVDTKNFPPELKATIDQLVNMVNSLTQQNKDLISTLGAEKTAREQAIAATKAQQEADQKKKVDELIIKAFGNGKTGKDAVKGKLPEAKRDFFTKLVQKDYEAAELFLNEHPGDPHMQTPQTNDNKGGGTKPPNPFTAPMGGNPAIAKAVSEQALISEKE